MTPAHMSKDLPDSWGIAPYAFAGWTLIVHEELQRQPFFRARHPDGQNVGAVGLVGRRESCERVSARNLSLQAN
jgi:hypothetical protein